MFNCDVYFIFITLNLIDFVTCTALFLFWLSYPGKWGIAVAVLYISVSANPPSKLYLVYVSHVWSKNRDT